MLQNGILYTSSRLVGTSVEDSDEKPVVEVNREDSDEKSSQYNNTPELPTSSCK